MKLVILVILGLALGCSEEPSATDALFNLLPRPIQSSCQDCCSHQPTRDPITLTYYQDSGRLTGEGVNVYGYSGNTAARNNPDRQCERNVGPVPATTYTLHTCQDSMHSGSKVRPCSFWMYPKYGNDGFDEVCGRSQIMIHGCRCCESNDYDHSEPPLAGCSAGCVIINEENRKKLRVGDTVVVQHYDPLGVPAQQEVE